MWIFRQAFRLMVPRRSTPVALAFAVLGLMLAGQLVAAPPKTGGLKGKVKLSVKGLKVLALKPLIVYLDGVDGALNYPTPSVTRKIVQQNALFKPNFLVVAAGQTVEFPNEDKFLHNVFSYSKGNTFDLGYFPKGESRSKVLKKSGVVRIYCSIHEDMFATIFVAPSPYHDRVSKTGEFEISKVPPGKYLLKHWSEALSHGSQEILIKAEEVSELTLEIKERAGAENKGVKVRKKQGS